jgi:hypothetical protein
LKKSGIFLKKFKKSGELEPFFWEKTLWMCQNLFFQVEKMKKKKSKNSKQKMCYPIQHSMHLQLQPLEFWAMSFIL